MKHFTSIMPKAQENSLNILPEHPHLYHLSFWILLLLKMSSSRNLNGMIDCLISERQEGTIADDVASGPI
jgi:hypothetical protein